jgi:hypothetical protein
MASPAHSRSLLVRGVFTFIAILISYYLVAYILAPLVWKGYAHLHPALDAAPTITLTSDDHPGDPLNVALIGTREQLEKIMAQAKWLPADPLGLRSDLRIAADTVLKRAYEKAPVSSLFLFGRKEDLAFEQPVGGNPSQRHHVRFWKAAEVDEQNRPLWFGSATYDERVGLSHTTGQITHHISGDVDAERDHILKTLQQTGGLTVEYVADFQPVHTGKNGGGDAWKTDGRLGVGTIDP